MKIERTHLEDCVVITPQVMNDERGYFFESFHLKKFAEQTGLNPNFVQDNRSSSKYGTLRGIHLQRGEYAQAKLVTVLKGEVLDVAIDLRKDSKTFGQYFSVILSAENNKQLYVPRGFGHGFSVLSDEAEFFYKCDNYYNKESEIGVYYSDQELNIDWQLSEDIIILSEKDKNNKLLNEVIPFL